MALQPLHPLATCTPPTHTRSWHTHPHPYLPLLATASSDKTLRIYSLTSFQLLTTITGGHKRSIRACAWKPGIKGDRESVLASGSFDANAGVWRVGNAVLGSLGSGEDEEGEGEGEDGGEVFRFSVVLEGHESEIKDIAWSANGTFLATCSRDKSVWIWETLDGTAGPGGGGGGGGGGGAAAPPRNPMHADADADADDDDDNLETVAVLQEHSGDVKCIAWHPTEENCLASGSYDEYIRIWREDLDGEWACVGVCEGHDGTVWSLAWEPPPVTSLEDLGHQVANGGGDAEAEAEPEEGKASSGPRILSASADLTIRSWRRRPKEPRKDNAGPRMPSIIRSSVDDEDWDEEAKLPQRHVRAVYSVAWSRRSRRVVSCGSDGKIVVYEEVTRVDGGEDTGMGGTDGDEGTNGAANEDSGHRKKSEWTVLYEVEAAHGVYEVNHVCWARRSDRGKRTEDEEVIVSTGDDGEVKVWTLDDP
ncbi:MAG: Cytosolic iron-sulfur protein assembly protein [Chrysothrix sp. TS-e1954]|nr:MAG: Cytosolic iron-sulfur protein assembly protein [Chrysothrix sp. TS-e1954]